jgi:signal transduction histidine kinase
MEAVQASVHHSLENCTICSACDAEGCPHRISDRLANCLGQFDNHRQYLMHLIDNMLDQRNMSMGTGTDKIPLDYTAMDWRRTLQHIKDLFALEMQAKNIFFEVYPIELPHPAVICDELRLERALINLVSNACEFTPNGGSVMVTLIETGPASVPYQGQEVPGAVYEIHVNDSGASMPPDILKHMAEPFELEGTSLGGLCITKGLITLLGGTIKISTMSGQGIGKDIVITLKLPFTEAGLDPFPANHWHNDKERYL